ncbi:hypothetical protein TNCV_163741 [Trichonephila clavipes]|nr:hypothetical protein TNCV_163741 [Trichonephila clavipes]
MDVALIGRWLRIAIGTCVFFTFGQLRQMPRYAANRGKLFLCFFVYRNNNDNIWQYLLFGREDQVNDCCDSCGFTRMGNQMDIDDSCSEV